MSQTIYQCTELATKIPLPIERCSSWKKDVSIVLKVQNSMSLNVHLHSGLLLSAINLIPFPFWLQLLI